MLKKLLLAAFLLAIFTVPVSANDGVLLLRGRAPVFPRLAAIQANRFARFQSAAFVQPVVVRQRFVSPVVVRQKVVRQVVRQKVFVEPIIQRQVIRQRVFAQPVVVEQVECAGFFH